MLSWKNDQVLLWLKNGQQPDDVLQCFRAHNITGMTLPMLNSQELKEMGISDLKQRLQLLNDINTLLIEKNMNLNLTNLNNEHPLLSELQTTIVSTSLIKNISKGIVDETSSQLLQKSESTDDLRFEKDRKRGDKDYHSLVSKINKLREEVLPILKDIQDNKPLPSPIVTENEQLNQSIVKSPQKASFLNRRSVSSPDQTQSANLGQISPPRFKSQSQFPQHRLSQQQQQHAIPSKISTTKSTTTNLTSPGQESSNNVSGDTLKQLRAKTEDPCYKILQAAMRSHRLDKSEWRKYVLVICYGGDKERVLRYDEKPVVVFKELNELGLSPSIMLRQVEETDDTGDLHDYYETPGGRL
jgi:hypothetical protein